MAQAKKGGNNKLFYKVTNVSTTKVARSMSQPSPAVTPSYTSAPTVRRGGRADGLYAVARKRSKKTGTTFYGKPLV